MSGLKSGAIVLLLAIPVFGYAAWQVQGVSRADLIVSDPPSDKGMPAKEQLAASKAKADKWVDDVKKVEWVTLGYRTSGRDDGISDPEWAGLADALANRSKDLTDLETFLSGVDDPKYAGKLTPRYQEWQDRRSKTLENERIVDKWFVDPLRPIDTPESASAAIAAFETKVDRYAGDTKFSDRKKVAIWRVRARIRVIDSLVDSAREPYEKVINLPLPLPSEADSPDVRKALGAPRAVQEQAKLLDELLKQAERDDLDLGRYRADAIEAIRRADSWKAGERLLGLFAEPTLFTNAGGAADWLGKVQTQFDRTQSTDDRARLRDKVQQFCEAFIPTTVLLDEYVLLDGKAVPRSTLQVKYFPVAGGASQRTKLSTLASGVNEFNVIQKHPGEGTLIISEGGLENKPNQIQPTEVSKAALAFMAARTDLRSGTGALKWSAKSIEELKNKCKPLAAEVNKLKVPGAKPETPDLWVRIENLAQGASACHVLFEKGP